MEDVREFVFPRLRQKPVFLRNEMLQSVRVQATFTDQGMEISIFQRHMTEGELLGPNQRIKLEEEED